MIVLLSFSAGVNAQTYLDFPGDNSVVLLDLADVAPPWTLEVMVCKAETNNYQHLLTASDSTSGVRLEQYESSRVGITKAGVEDWYFKYSLPMKQWVRLTLVCDTSGTRLYADGVPKGSVKASIPLAVKWIGRPMDEGGLSAGLREFRIWKVVMDSATVAEWFDKDPEQGHPQLNSLVHWFRMDEGIGRTISDSKGGPAGRIIGPIWAIPTERDLGITRRMLPERSPDNYGDAEPVSIRVKNYGSSVLHENFIATLNGMGKVYNVNIEPGSAGMLPGESREVRFPDLDINTAGRYDLKFRISLSGDTNPLNDTLSETLVSDSRLLGDIKGMKTDSSCFTFDCGRDKVRLILYTPDIFRIWLGPGGDFTDPAADDIVTKRIWPKFKFTVLDKSDYYLISTGKAAIRVYKKPARFALYSQDNLRCIWEERTPLDMGCRTFQYLKPLAGAHFYGCGMQNGYFAHKGRQVTIGLKITNWDDGSVPNPAPFYMSTAGYGAFRNTFAPGRYDFRQAMSFGHDEQRFDCWYFSAISLKDILDLYTSVTGRPFMPPRWGLELGDANCYNRKGQSTPVVISEIADKYRENNMPGGWILPNDGYGCGYVKLDSVSSELAKRGFHTGLWTENGLSKLPWEVGTAGVRAYKLDVAWVGPGYKQALDACKQAFNGIENNSNGRGFVWSVCGWAGTQAYSTVWSGDQKGSWEYIRFHIPTIIGAGLSGFSNASSDLDGIFGGSEKTYIRDLEWKVFIPEFYAMSGWAKKNRQPWVNGEPYASIARENLNFKMQIAPYLYTCCHKAYESGVPVVRAMDLEFPADSNARGNICKYQFMCGEWLLVAPVYKDTLFRDSIYLPAGRWTDIHTGKVLNGPQMLRNYEAPLERIPVFARGGAIIPMQTRRLFDSERTRDTLILEIWPDGHTASEIYEDDGSSKDFRKGGFSKTLIGCRAPEAGKPGPIYLAVSAAKGEYKGKPLKRFWEIRLHSSMTPKNIMMNDTRLKKYNSPAELISAGKGWCYDPDPASPCIRIKTGYVTTSASTLFKIY